MINIFRALIIISTLSYAAFACVGFVDTPYLSEKELDILSWSGHEAFIELPLIINWAIIIVWLPLAIGMYYFNPLSRLLYLSLSIISTITYPLFGIVVATGYEFMFLQITTVLDGAILVMAYFTSISENFKRHNKSLNRIGAKNAPPG